MYIWSFVAQDDILLLFLTAEETFFFSAMLRVRGTYQHKLRKVERVISELGLERC